MSEPPPHAAVGHLLFSETTVEIVSRLSRKYAVKLSGIGLQMAMTMVIALVEALGADEAESVLLECLAIAKGGIAHHMQAVPPVGPLR